MPKISVIVPVYKVEEYLPRCVDSILAQTFADFELILVDDGSPDRCGAICEEYAEKDTRVHVIHQENAGQACARNRGIEWVLNNSNSEWICFIDSDDWINKTYLEGLYEAADQCKCLISACDFAKSEREEGEADGSDEGRIECISPSELYNQHFYVVQSPCCKLFEKKLFENDEFRFPEGILYEDSALIYRIIFSQDRIAFTDRSTYYYYQRPDSSMNAKWHPKRMAYCHVQGQQLQWLAEHRHDDCVKTCLCHYLSALHYHQSLIRGIPEYKQYARTMRGAARNALRRYGKRCTLSLREQPQLYQAAYPRLVELYWMMNAQLSKLKPKKNLDA